MAPAGLGPRHERGGPERVSFHDLRRAAATALVRDGVDLKTAQTRLGHSDPRLTLASTPRRLLKRPGVAAERLGQRFFGMATI